MTERLRYTLVVRHPDTNAATALVSGEPVPAWARGLVQADDVDGELDEKPKRSVQRKS